MKKNSQGRWQAIAVASQIGFTIATALIITIVGGNYLDRWLGTGPIFLLLGIFVGLITAGVLFYELATGKKL